MVVDPYGILRPNSKLSHNLVLVAFHLYVTLSWHAELSPLELSYLFMSQVSAYSSFARTKGIGLQAEQRRRVDPMSNEPLFTKYTRDYIGTVDYIFYTGMLLIF